MGKTKFNPKNSKFIASMFENYESYTDYLNRFQKIALSMFEWVNLPESMDSRYLEECLFYYGQAALLYDENYGFINTKCATNGQINIYGLPSALNCFSYGYNTYRKLYTGLPSSETEEAILVMNNWQRVPTLATMELFAKRLAEADMTAIVNIKAQKTPVLIITDENQRLTLENMYSQYEGNRPVIFADKNAGLDSALKSIQTEAPYIADKVMEYKNQIFNEALTFLGINSLSTEKKERLITDEASANNELTNFNLQSALIPRQKAAEEFNKKFGLSGDKAISVRLRSDLYNLIKQNDSVVNDYNNNGIDDKLEGEE